MYTLSAQTEQRNFEETRRRLEQARELVLAFAIVNGRLPCPARSAATAAPLPSPATRSSRTATGCIGDAVTDYYGGVSGGVVLGLLPARTIGYQQVGFGRLRDRCLGQPHPLCGREPRPTQLLRHVRPRRISPIPMNLKANGISCQPNDLLICKSATGITATTCGGAANQIMSQSLVVAIIYSTGKNGATGAAGGIDEAANLNGDRDIRVPHADARPAPRTANSTTSSPGSPSASSTAS